MYEDRYVVLDTALKIHKSKKYKNKGILLSKGGERSFAGILCQLLKNKINLLSRDIGHCTRFGVSGYVGYIPREIVNYFFADFEKAKNIQHEPESLVALFKESLKAAK